RPNELADRRGDEGDEQERECLKSVQRGNAECASTRGNGTGARGGTRAHLHIPPEQENARTRPGQRQKTALPYERDGLRRAASALERACHLLVSARTAQSRAPDRASTVNELRWS